MEIIGKFQLQQDAQKHNDVRKAINAFIKVVEASQWSSFMDIKETYRRSASYVEGWTIFNIKGNDYRLIVSIDYDLGLVHYEALLTHAEYDKHKF